MRLFIATLLFLSAMSVSCADPIAPLVRAQFPNCQLLKSEESKGSIMATMQCGPEIRVVKFHKKK